MPQFIAPAAVPAGAAGASPGWLNRALGLIAPADENEGVFTANPLKTGLNLLGTPWSVATSTLKEVTDLFGGVADPKARHPLDEASFSDWWAQIAKPGRRVGVGDIISGRESWGGVSNPLRASNMGNPLARVAAITAGFAGDVLLDPLSYLIGVGGRVSQLGGRAARAGALTEPATRWAEGLRIGVRRGDADAAALSNRLADATGRVAELDRAWASSTLEARAGMIGARQAADGELAAVGKQVAEWMDASGVGAEYDRAVMTLARPGGGPAAVTDRDMIRLIGDSDELGGLRLQRFWKTTGGIELVSPRLWAAWTAPLRAVRGKVTGGKRALALRDRFGEESKTRITRLAIEHAAANGNPRWFAAMAGARAGMDRVRWAKREMQNRYTGEVNAVLGGRSLGRAATTALADAIETPTEMWAQRGVEARLAEHGFDSGDVERVRDLFGRLHQEAEALGLDIGFLGETYLPVRIKLGELEGLDPDLAARSAMEHVRGFSEQFLGQEVATVQRMLRAGVVEPWLTDKGKPSGRLRVVEGRENEMDWAGWRADLDEIASRQIPDFDADLFVRDPEFLLKSQIYQVANRWEAVQVGRVLDDSGIGPLGEDLEKLSRLEGLRRKFGAESEVAARLGRLEAAAVGVSMRIAGREARLGETPLTMADADQLAVLNGLLVELRTVVQTAVPADPGEARALAAYRELLGAVAPRTGLWPARKVAAVAAVAEVQEAADGVASLAAQLGGVRARLLESARGEVAATLPTVGVSAAVRMAGDLLVETGRGLGEWAGRALSGLEAVAPRVGLAVTGADLDELARMAGAVRSGWAGQMRSFEVVRGWLPEGVAAEWLRVLGSVEEGLSRGLGVFGDAIGLQRGRIAREGVPAPAVPVVGGGVAGRVADSITDQPVPAVPEEHTRSFGNAIHQETRLSAMGRNRLIEAARQGRQVRLELVDDPQWQAQQQRVAADAEASGRATAEAEGYNWYDARAEVALQRNRALAEFEVGTLLDNTQPAAEVGVPGDFIPENMPPDPAEAAIARLAAETPPGEMAVTRERHGDVIAPTRMSRRLLAEARQRAAADLARLRGPEGETARELFNAFADEFAAVRSRWPNLAEFNQWLRTLGDPAAAVDELRSITAPTGKKGRLVPALPRFVADIETGDPEQIATRWFNHPTTTLEAGPAAQIADLAGTLPPLAERPAGGAVLDDARQAQRVRDSLKILSAERAAHQRLTAELPAVGLRYADEAAKAAFWLRDDGELLRRNIAEMEAEVAANPGDAEALSILERYRQAIGHVEHAGKLSGDLLTGDRGITSELLSSVFNVHMAETDLRMRLWLKGESGRIAAETETLTEVAAQMEAWGRNERALRAFRDEFGRKIAMWHGHALPADMAEAVDMAFKLHQPSDVLRKVNDVATWWRGMALLSPGYHARNAYGGIFNNIAVLGATVADHTRLIGEYTRWWRNQPVKDRQARDWIEESFLYGSVGQGQFGREIADVPVSDTTWDPSAGLPFGDPTRRTQQWRLVHANRQVGNHVENVLRLVAGWQGAKSAAPAGGARARQTAALAAIARTQFDYHNVSQFESKWLRNTSMFWTWMSRNMILQADMVTARPALFQAGEHLYRNIGAGAPLNPYAPQYYDENEYVQWDQRRWLTMEVPPLAAMRDVNKAVGVVENRGGGSSVVRAVSEFSPFFREGLELLTGRDALRGYELEGSDRYRRALGATLPLYARARRLAPQVLGGSEGERERWLSSWFGFFGVPVREVSAPEMRREARLLDAEVASAARRFEMEAERREMMAQARADRANARLDARIEGELAAAV